MNDEFVLKNTGKWGPGVGGQKYLRFSDEMSGIGGPKTVLLSYIRRTGQKSIIFVPQMTVFYKNTESYSQNRPEKGYPGVKEPPERALRGYIRLCQAYTA